MMYQTQWMGTMMNMARNSFDLGLRTMETVSQQTEKAMDLAMNNANMIQGETRKMVDTWVDNCKNVQRICTDVVKDGLESFEQQFGNTNKSTPAAPKSK